MPAEQGLLKPGGWYKRFYFSRKFVL